MFAPESVKIPVPTLVKLSDFVEFVMVPVNEELVLLPVVCVGIVSTALQNEQKELAEVSMISAPQLNRTTAGLTEDDTAALSGVYDTVPADGELA